MSRSVAATLIFIASSSIAYAAEPAVSACERVSAYYFDEPHIVGTSVEYFPEFSPIRVRLRATATRETDLDAMSNLLNPDAPKSVSTIDHGRVVCEFRQPHAPFGLVSFCVAAFGGCGPIDKGRLKEIQILMQRAGD
jgi:hypothetical protein